MASRRWLSGATAVAQVTTITIGGTIVIGDTFTVTINGKAVTIAALTTNSATTAAQLQAALAASLNPEFEDAVWTLLGSVITATATTPGVPFTLSVSTTSAAGTITQATPTPSAGPNDWSTAGNWSGGALPATGDDVSLDTAASIYYGLGQSGVTLASLTIPPSFGNAKLGLPEYNQAGYAEYRPTSLTLGATAVTVNCQSSRIKINTGSVATTANVQGTGAGELTGLEALLFQGTSASNVFNVTAGEVGIAVLGGQTSNISGGLNIGYLTNIAGDARVRCGSGTTLAGVNKLGGQLTLYSGTTSLEQTAGDTTILGGAHTAINVDGGRLFYQSTGTIGTLKTANAGQADFSRDLRARTVTNCQRYGPSKINDPFRTVTWTNGVIVERGNDLSGLQLGNNITLSVAAGP